MKINNTEIVDTYAEAFSMWSAKVIITAENDYWAEGAARAMTGMATSVIGCKCEAGIDMKLTPEKTPDGRPGYSILVFTMDKASLGKRLIERIRSLEPAIDSIHNIIIELRQSNLLLGYQKPLKIVINFYVNFVGKFG